MAPRPEQYQPSLVDVDRKEELIIAKQLRAARVSIRQKTPISSWRKDDVENTSRERNGANSSRAKVAFRNSLDNESAEKCYGFPVEDPMKPPWAFYETPQLATNANTIPGPKLRLKSEVPKISYHLNVNKTSKNNFTSINSKFAAKFEQREGIYDSKRADYNSLPFFHQKGNSKTYLTGESTGHFPHQKTNDEIIQDPNVKNNQIHGPSCFELLSPREKPHLLAEKLGFLDDDDLTELVSLLPLQVSINLGVSSKITSGQV